MGNRDLPLMVTIRCITYNHEPYIRQCLEGFVIQKTNFHFEAIVHDDASTDGTAAIIREYAAKYPDIIKPIFETENQYSKHDGSLQRIMNEHTHGKYVAICEGDDYWTDPLKLQKQVDYLQSHPSCVIAHSNFSYYMDREKRYYVDVSQDSFNANADESNRKQIMRDILCNNKYRVTAVTAMYRKESYDQICKTYSSLLNKFLMGDTQLWICLISLGDIHYFKEPMAVYRKHEGSATFGKSSIDILRFRLSAAEMRYFTSLSFSELNCECEKYEKLLIKELCKYVALDSNYSSFVLDLIKTNNFRMKLANCIRKYFIIRFPIYTYYQAIDVIRFVYRKLK